MTNNLYILVAGAASDGAPVPLLCKDHIDDIIKYIRENLKYYPYEFLKIYTVNPRDCLKCVFVDDKLFIS